MSTPGSIVVGTDGSERAERAVERAGEIAKTLAAPVHVVSCYKKESDARVTTAAARGVPAGEGGNEGETHIRAQQYVNRAQERLARVGVESQAHIWPGEPAEALLRIADEQHAQMIVVGNRGMSGARRVLGSVPNRVSHHARCDVLIVDTGGAEGGAPA